jgi:hypothetical protein
MNRLINVDGTSYAIAKLAPIGGFMPKCIYGEMELDLGLTVII